MRRRRNPGGAGIGGLLVGALAGGLGAAAIYGGLAFQSTITGNAQAAAGAGIGVAAGLLVGMMGSPEIGAGIAAGAVGTGLAQFATSEVAAYQANQSPSTNPPTTSAVNGPGDRLPLRAVNGPGDSLPVHTNAALMAAARRLRNMGMR
jgi:hypothetical protein